MWHILKNHSLDHSRENDVIPHSKNNLISVTFPPFLRSSSSDDPFPLHHDMS